jgi:hypothetical protein
MVRLHTDKTKPVSPSANLRETQVLDAEFAIRRSRPPMQQHKDAGFLFSVTNEDQLKMNCENCRLHF